MDDSPPTTEGSGESTANLVANSAAPQPSQSHRPISRSSKFSKAEQKKIYQGLDSTNAMLLQKSKELSRWNQNDKDDFFKAFGTDSDDARDLIKARTERLLKISESMTMGNFVPAIRQPGMSDEDFNNIYAYAFRDDQSHTIHIGPRFWTSPDVGYDSTGATIVHELSHFADKNDCAPDAKVKVCGTLDGFIDPKTGKEAVDETSGKKVRMYGPTASSKLSSSRALHHASSYEGYLTGFILPRSREKGAQ